MSDAKKAVELYQLMATRCKAGKFTQNQASIYAEMAEFLKDCASAEEMQEKIKNSKYYLAPGVAQTKDMIFALSEAAVANDLPEVKAICDKQLEKIAQDENAIYDSAYQTEAMAIINKYSQTLESFASIFECYIQFNFIEEMEDEDIAKIQDKMNRAFDNLSLPSANFKELSKIAKFRDLIFLNDDEYEEFINKAESYRTSAPSFKEEMTSAQAEADKAWATINSQKAEITSFGKTQLDKTRIKLCTVIAPNSKDGKYAFENEEVIR